MPDARGLTGAQLAQAGGGGSSADGVGDKLFGQMLAFQWRGINAPFTKRRVSFEQDLAFHARPDRDGVKLEATGRQALVLTYSLLFLNSLLPGPNEAWGAGDDALYPTQWFAFLGAMADRSTGDLQDPAIGLLRAKPRSFSSDMEARVRDGETVEVSFVESSEDEDASNLLFSGNSPKVKAKTAAAELDSFISTSADAIKAQVAGADPDAGISFEDMLDSVTALIDGVALAGARIAALPGRLLFRLQRVGDAIARLGNAQTWPITDAIERLKEAARDLQATQQQNASKNVKVYTVRADTTLGELAARLNQQALDLLKLNHELAQEIVIPKGSQVRYYA